MRQALLILILACFLTGCTRTVADRYFFDFEEVVHYRIDEKSIIYGSDIKTKSDSLTWNFVHGWREDGKLDTKLLENLNESKFTGRVIDTAFYPQLREIFSEKYIGPESPNFSDLIDKTEMPIMTASLTSVTVTTVCEPVFRDLYLFKNKNRITGFAKICFDCSISEFYGTSASTASFGRSKFIALKQLHNEKFIK